MRAVILAGGGGTRLRPLTNTTPKPMLEFMGRPYAIGLLRRLADVGVDHLDLLVGQATDAFAPLVEAGRGLGVAVDVLTEERPLDTAGAARRLLRGAGEADVIVCNGDVLTDLDYADLVKHHREAGAVATIALTRVEDTSSFGVIERDDDGRIRAFIEKPPPGTTDVDTVNAGTYVLDAAAFDPFPGDGPLSFERDVFPGLLRAGALLRGVAYDVHWQDLGTPQRFRDGHRAVLERRCAWPVPAALEWRADGVAVHRTATVDADATLIAPVVVGPGATVGRDALLAGAIVLAGVRIGDGATVTDSIVGPGTRIAGGVEVGPRAVLVADGV
ncbi:MAG TPA: NDP-sugar synthase [Euzebyales bacterium]|nr:NDP-sugar synthase [Euzebyales bacterium]